MRRRTFYLADAIWGKMEILAKSRGTTVSDMVRRAIFEFLQREV